MALQIPAYDYAHPSELVELAQDAAEVPLIVALDGVTDPRNLGAIARSATAFGAHGMLIPSRRSAGVTGGAWKTSAGTLANLPVARAANLTAALREYREAGLFVIGLDGEGTGRHRRRRPAGRAAGRRGGLRGQGAVAAGPGALRRRGPDSHAGGGGVAERGGGGGVALYEVARHRRR